MNLELVAMDKKKQISARVKEKKAILRFGKQYWENNNNIIDEEVIHAFISQYV